MSRQSKGPRLYLRKGRTDSRSGKRLPDRWFIRDGSVQISTGCGPESLRDAERQLATYIASKWDRPSGESDPSKVLIADALALYARERGSKLKATPATMAGFVAHLLSWWGERTLADVRRTSCQAYVAHRTSQPIVHGNTGRTVSAQTARRELEVLSAAIGFWDSEHHLTRRPAVILPEKPESNRDALSRSEAAALLLAAMGWRLTGGKWAPVPGAAKSNRKHMRRFILIGLYTGSRSGVIKRLRWTESLDDPWVDLASGVIYRRGRNETESRTKRRPIVKMPRRLLAHMRRWYAQDKTRGIDTVLHFGGEPVSAVRTGFTGCVKDAGLSGPTPHWLRHTCCTWLMERGVDIWEAAGYAGMSPTTLQQHYGHHRPDHQSAARKALG